MIRRFFLSLLLGSFLFPVLTSGQTPYISPSSSPKTFFTEETKKATKLAITGKSGSSPGSTASSADFKAEKDKYKKDDTGPHLYGLHTFKKYFWELYSKKIIPISILGAIVIVIVGGIFIVASGGDPNKINIGKDLIWGAIVGLILILLSEIILESIEPSLSEIFHSS